MKWRPVKSDSQLSLNLEGKTRILFIGNYWPYARGGHRVAALADSAAAHDVALVILTSTLNESPAPRERVWVVETLFKGDVYRFVRRLFGRGVKVGGGLKGDLQGGKKSSLRSKTVSFLFKAFATFFEVPDAERSWRRHAHAAAAEVIGSNEIDLVVSGYPLSTHFVAAKIKKEYGVPWIADLTDLWSANHNYPYFGWRRSLDRRAEISVLGAADHVLTVSEQWAETEARLLPGVPVSTVLHGFPDELLYIETPLASEITLSYVGALYEKQDGFEAFLNGLAEAFGDNTVLPLRIRFIGTSRVEVERRLSPRVNTSNFEFVDRVPRSIAAAMMAESHALLLFGSSADSWSGVYPSKVFDYLGVRRPVIYVGGHEDDLMSRLIAKTGAGGHFVSGETLASHLIDICRDDWDHQFERTVEQLESVRSYSHGAMTSRIYSIFEQVAGERGV